jgi:transcriptional regulator with XRE-family HTH domain
MSELTSTARRRELGAELRRLRERLGLKGQDMAARLEWTPCQLSRVETGKRSMDPLEIIRYAALCGLNKSELADLLALAREPDDYRIKRHDGKLPDALRTLIFHESTASAIDIYETIYIPGITQTEDYMRALFVAGGEVDPVDLEKYVQIRLARRHVLTRLNPAHCTLYIHENALRMPVGDPWIMHEQMLHLLFVGSRPQCSIRVVPVSGGPKGVAAAAFWIFRYPEGAPVIYLRHQTTSDFLEDPGELRAYQKTLNLVASVALTDAESREFIAWMASEYEQQGAAQNGSGPGVAQE